MIFMAVSAIRGEMRMASVRLPRQEHGRCQPIAHKPTRYTNKFAVNHATKIKPSCRDLPSKQILAITNSNTPTQNIKCPNCNPRMGSTCFKIPALPKLLAILAAAVVRSTPPAENKKILVSCACTENSTRCFALKPWKAPLPYVLLGRTYLLRSILRPPALRQEGDVVKQLIPEPETGLRLVIATIRRNAHRIELPMHKKHQPVWTGCTYVALHNNHCKYM